MESTPRMRLVGFLKIAGIGLFAYTFIGLAMQGYGVQWTGFGKPPDDSMQAKTLWDWMNLLLVPLFLAGGTLLLSRSKHDTDREHGEERATVERAIAVDHQQEAALQSYIDRMADLLLRDKLSRFSSDEVRNVARIRTLTVFRGLDSKRKGSVLLFLKDSGLIDREAVIDLSGADLSGASVMFANLNRVNLSEANLSGADLRGTNLGKSYLSGTNLSGANLSRANLGGADLFEATLSGANFNQTNLANLRGANLGGAKLLGADLREADLSQADLSGTEITETELGKAKSLEGTTMPDGTKHD